MAPDIRLVPDAAQGNPDVFPAQGFGDGFGYGGFAHAGRPRQADDLPLDVGGQLPDGNQLQNALLHLFHAVMVVIQHLGGLGHVGVVLGDSVPGQGQHRLQVAAHHLGLLGLRGHPVKPVALLQKLFPGFLGNMLNGLDGVGVFRRFLLGVVPFAQLLADDPQLFPEEVVPLVFVHGFLDLAVNILLQA